ncbi:MAG: hypothetical protein WC682_02725 [Parcubacteria group bacterium]|jgi:hypothetical protein
MIFPKELSDVIPKELLNIPKGYGRVVYMSALGHFCVNGKSMPLGHSIEGINSLNMLTSGAIIRSQDGMALLIYRLGFVIRIIKRKEKDVLPLLPNPGVGISKVLV